MQRRRLRPGLRRGAARPSMIGGGLDRGQLALLHRLGVASLADLATQEPSKLASMMRYVNLREGLVRRTPHAMQLRDWIEDAAKPRGSR